MSFRHSTHTPGTGAPPDGLSAILKLSFCDLVVAPVESNSIGQSSQVQTSADYAKLSLAGAKAIMLAPKEVHPQLGASLCIKAHSALLELCGAPHNANSLTDINSDFWQNLSARASCPRGASWRGPNNPNTVVGFVTNPLIFKPPKQMIEEEPCTKVVTLRYVLSTTTRPR